MASSSDQVCELVRTQILFGELRPGQAVSQRTLAANLGVSQTPVREALLRLRHEGLVELAPVAGYVVRRWTPKDIRDRFGLRRAIEGMAIERAAEVITPAVVRRLYAICDEGERLLHAGRTRESFQTDRQFHTVLVSASGSREITRAARILGHLNFFLFYPKPLPVETRLDVFRGHRRIVAALAEGSAAEAAAALDEHLATGEERLAAWCEELHAQSYDLTPSAELVAAISGLAPNGKGGGG